MRQPLDFFRGCKYLRTSGSLLTKHDQALQFNFILPHVPGSEKPAADYLSCLDEAPANRVHLKLTNSIPIHRIEIGRASKTPKQDEDEDDFNPDDTNSPDTATPISLPKKQIDFILTMVTKRDRENVDEYQCRQISIKQQPLNQGKDSSPDTDYFIQFVTKSSRHHPERNQVSPQG